MNYSYRPALLLLTLIISAFTFGQKVNAYKFIEPNISVSYDSSLFKISNRYSNSFYETESYDFACQLDKANNIIIHVEADHPGPVLFQRTIDSVMLIDLKRMRNEIPKSLSIISIDRAVRHWNGFSFIGIVAYDKKKKEYGTSVRGFHVTENDKTEIRYFSKGRDDLEKGYGILKLFLKDFKSYSENQFEKEDSLIKREYTVHVQATKELPDELRMRKRTFLGTVIVERPLKQKISEVRIDMSIGQEIFLPNDMGTTTIVCYDEKKGVVEKTGELIVLNSFGKKVKIPFSFSYENKGPQ
jgi:hypothetical protein